LNYEKGRNGERKERKYEAKRNLIYLSAKPQNKQNNCQEEKTKHLIWRK